MTRMLHKALLILLLFWGCRGHLPHTPPWPIFTEMGKRDPVVVAAALEKRAHYPTNLKAKVRIAASGLDSSVGELLAEVLLARPDLVRIRAYTPLGGVGFDLLYLPDRIELLLPHRKEFVTVPLTHLDSLEFNGTPLHLPTAEEWWRLFIPWKRDLQLEKPSLLEGDTAQSGILVFENQRLTFDWETGRITHLRLARRFTIDYPEVFYAHGHEYPARALLRVDRPEKKTSPVNLMLKIEDIEENLALPPSVFAPLPRDKMKVIGF